MKLCWTLKMASSVMRRPESHQTRLAKCSAHKLTASDAKRCTMRHCIALRRPTSQNITRRVIV